jgi:type II secretory pathway component PulF
LEEALLFVLAVFAIAVFAAFLFFFNKHVCSHFKNQLKVTLPAYKSIQRIGKVQRITTVAKTACMIAYQVQYDA